MPVPDLGNVMYMITFVVLLLYFHASIKVYDIFLVLVLYIHASIKSFPPKIKTESPFSA